MGVCSVCFERFNDPVCLPCGHLFCRRCLQKSVDAATPTQSKQHCPTCRAPYNLVTIDPALVPEYLRPYILPAIRPIYIGDPPQPHTTSNPTAIEIAEEDRDKAELGAEITALRESCAAWQQRAEVHAAANAGLLGFARAAKEHAIAIKVEKLKAAGRVEILRKRLAELVSEEELNALMTAEVELPKLPTMGAGPPVPGQPLPVFSMQLPQPPFYNEIAPTLAGQSSSSKGPPVVFGPNDIAAHVAANVKARTERMKSLVDGMHEYTS
ncbi:hypothetical protein HMN09_00686000 [Mycena chlorophos]|uniref:RING-type domain-containing protein n=1 Tax=Mycena chlorophos TaxID=658473 RepID=A0A8H6SZW1_MYCCL|nr:hypothetical protein HMN09_00686000 [Mycena chlorophos]